MGVFTVTDEETPLKLPEVNAALARLLTEPVDGTDVTLV
jgi:hypothetical protein